MFSKKSVELFWVSAHAMHFIGANKIRINGNLNGVICDFDQSINDIAKRAYFASAYIINFAGFSVLKKRKVGLAYGGYVIKLPLYVEIAQFNSWRILREMSNEFGYEEIIMLPWAGIVKRSGNNDRQSIKKSFRHFLHGHFTHCIVIDWLEWVIFWGRAKGGISIDCSATGQQDLGGFLG